MGGDRYEDDLRWLARRERADRLAVALLAVSYAVLVAAVILVGAS